MADRPATQCPDDGLLDDFVSGRADPDAVARIEAHLGECGECGAVVRALAPAVRVSEAAESVPLSATVAATPATAAQDAPLPPGTRLGRYEIQRIVGAGGMGAVYAAHDPALDRRVALKLIRPALGPGVAVGELASRLLREGKAMARLSHPNVVTVYDVDEVEGQVFVAMEFIEGRTVREWLRERPRTQREILDVFLAAGRGLAAAHDAGLVHRDFKPDNVLVRTDGRVCVTDFGLARLPDGGERKPGVAGVAGAAATPGGVDVALTRTGVLMGTPAYMPLEQLESVGADVRADVFAFCVSLWEALYGERPFRGVDLFELHANVRDGRVSPPSRDARVPARLRALLLGGLRPDAADRYASMAPLLEGLARPGRSRALPWAAATVVLLGLAGLAVASQLGRRGTLATSAASAAAAAGTSVGCTSHRACTAAHGGEAWICNPASHACVPLASDDCAPRFEPEDLDADDTVWLGALLPMKGPAAEADGSTQMQAVDLARRELAQATRSMTGSSAAVRLRRVALVGCDDREDPMRAARHLVDDVGVPAILGLGSGQEVVDVAGGLLAGRGVLGVASLSTDPRVTRVPHAAGTPPPVWRTTFSIDDLAGATASLLRDVLEPVRGGAGARAVLACDDAAVAARFAEALPGHLVSRPPEAPSAADVARAAGEVVEARARFVVLLGASAACAQIADAVEARWPPQAPRPTYVAANASLAPFRSWIGPGVERRRRLFAVQRDPGRVSNARFVLRYSAANGHGATATVNPGASYDAFYLLAYATYALGREPVTGASLAGAFARLVPPAQPIEVGPTQVFDALALLNAGRPIDLEGAASALDFDLGTGETPSDFALMCADVESGVVYRGRSRRTEGTLRCP